ncbi:PEP-CTERM sorting domain-containing protein [Haloferula rosea]|uniref:PEP-CTERM sorting domain-containing protein n=1 Tax=Haloferula rosea TaxID=490093 RepID=A0A934RBZ5_9BACT|nr:PEP-CTERM sorting domain-containing protein [Haloferula rosea]MBK1826812.1 PEP-CTERM sorting domain-containing protein [Haloferula rosea]
MIRSTVALIATATLSHAAITVSLPGNQESSGWDQLNNTNTYWADNGYTTSYPGATPWPGSIAANMTGSIGSATFAKLSGNGYFAGSSIYDGGGAGTYSLSDASPLAGLATVVFQLDVGTPVGVTPVLNFNGGSQALAADFSTMVAGGYSTINFTTGQSFPTSNYAWQWDLTGLAVSSYEIVWGSNTNNHLTQYEVNLTTGDSFAQVVPEPSVALLSLAGLFLSFRRRRN